MVWSLLKGLLPFALVPALLLISVVSLVRSLRRLRRFDYLDRTDPEAYDAIVVAEHRQIRRCLLSIGGNAALLLLVGTAFVSLWRDEIKEADRLDRLSRAEVGAGSQEEARVTFERHRTVDHGRTLRLYFYRPPDNDCVLTRVDVQERGDEVWVSGYLAPASVASQQPKPGIDERSCSGLFFEQDPNRYVEVRLTSPLGRRVVRDN
jgi:hypothetical protein